MIQIDRIYNYYYLYENMYRIVCLYFFLLIFENTNWNFFLKTHWISPIRVTLQLSTKRLKSKRNNICKGKTGKNNDSTRGKSSYDASHRSHHGVTRWFPSGVKFTFPATPSISFHSIDAICLSFSHFKALVLRDAS